MKRWDHGELDRLLDESLKEFSGEDPRQGLEQRILANLADPVAPKRMRWWKAFPVAAALLIAAALWIWMPRKTAPAPEVVRIPAAPVVNVTHMTPRAVAYRQHRMRKPTRKLSGVANAGPKLPTFPSQADETQARLALRFVQGNPHEAQEVIGEQKEFRDLVARNAEPSQNSQQETSEER